MRLIRIKLFFALVLLVQFCFGQSKETLFKLGDEFFKKGKYFDAVNYYTASLEGAADSLRKKTIFESTAKTKEKGIKVKKYDVDYLVYQIAECHRLLNDYTRAEFWYSRASKIDNPEYLLSHYWLGNSLMRNGKYEAAIVEFEWYMENSAYNKSKVYDAIDNIGRCKYALNQIAISENVYIQHVRLTEDPTKKDFACSFTLNDKGLLFTSAQAASSFARLGSDGGSLINYTDIYLAKRVGDSAWADIKKIPLSIKGINTGIASTSQDFKTMYFTRWKGITENGEFAIYFSKFVDNEWTKPKMLNENINKPGYRSLMPYYSEEEGVLYFASDIPRGVGRYDIWFAKVDENGEAGIAYNLGERINTPGDDLSPFYNYPKRTLYYSSDGRIGMGGLDIYKSEGSAYVWGPAYNLGYPINSARKDYFYVVSKDQCDAYFSSDRIECNGPSCLELFHASSEPAFIINDKILSQQTAIPVQGVNVALVTPQNVKVASAVSDSSGWFELRFQREGDYKLLFRKEGYLTAVRELSTLGLKMPYQYPQKKALMTKIEMNKPIRIDNIYYYFDKATLTKESLLILDSLAMVLKENPHLLIEIGSHCDSKGELLYNDSLSGARGKSVVNYLIRKGIDPTLLTSKGYGERMPFARNENFDGTDNPEGRELNRRTEFKIVGIRKSDNGIYDEEELKNVNTELKE